MRRYYTPYDHGIKEHTSEAFYDRSEVNARITELEAQRDELLEALEACLNYISNTEVEFGITLESGDKARAVIDKAKESK